MVSYSSEDRKKGDATARAEVAIQSAEVTELSPRSDLKEGMPSNLSNKLQESPEEPRNQSVKPQTSGVNVSQFKAPLLSDRDRPENPRVPTLPLNKLKSGSQAQLGFNFHPVEDPASRQFGNRSKSNSQLGKFVASKTERATPALHPIPERRTSMVNVSNGQSRENCSYSLANIVFKQKKDAPHEVFCPGHVPKPPEPRISKAGVGKVARRKPVAPLDFKSLGVVSGKKSREAEHPPRTAGAPRPSGVQKIISRAPFDETRFEGRPTELKMGLGIPPISPMIHSHNPRNHSDDFISNSDLAEEELKILKPKTPSFDKDGRQNLDSFGSKTKPDYAFPNQSGGRLSLRQTEAADVDGEA